MFASKNLTKMQTIRTKWQNGRISKNYWNELSIATWLSNLRDQKVNNFQSWNLHIVPNLNHHFLWTSICLTRPYLEVFFGLWERPGIRELWWGCLLAGQYKAIRLAGCVRISFICSCSLSEPKNKTFAYEILVVGEKGEQQWKRGEWGLS